MEKEINDSLKNPKDFYNNENILSEEIISEYDEIECDNLYVVRTVKITYENGKNVIVTQKIVSDNIKNSEYF